MSTVLRTVTNQTVPKGTFTTPAANVPVSAVSGIELDIDRTGLPAGRAADGLLCDIGMMVTYDGTTWLQYSAEIAGGVLQDDNGSTLTIQPIKFEWRDLGRPSQAKLFCNAYVSFHLTATLSAF